MREVVLVLGDPASPEVSLCCEAFGRFLQRRGAVNDDGADLVLGPADSQTALDRLSRAGDDGPGVGSCLATPSGSVGLGVKVVPRLGQVDWSGLSSGFWLDVAWLSIGPTAVAWLSIGPTAVAWLSIGPTAVAYLVYVRGIRDVGPGAAASTMFAVPLFGTFSSFVFLGESLSLAQAAAAAVMLVGAVEAVFTAPTAAPHSHRSGALPNPALEDRAALAAIGAATRTPPRRRPCRGRTRRGRPP